ncbi:FtsX-like permease family protein [Paucibacter sp. DJ2R-2]|uniref:FtsX-like permease family protein n=1 Tax=Paucibacter sp. DJ2R-2 TaxID=2893558 RepID=UPI0021E4393E|nr:FtsX-like permease family protein [Paucibacter sp. DJ2R-2]MCV2423219.1 ABC transporter permease [Paucibacter sp. DJ4R-1]MCV2440675.1 ABC transporter permease [Paucibacter sp. DJ2R-2]
MLDDLRHTWQSLLRHPGHALLSLLTLSCGLGFAIYAAGVYFSFTAGDLPFPEPERLVAIEASRDGERSQAKSVHYLDLLEYQRQTPSLEGLLPLQTGIATLGGHKQYPANFQVAHIPAEIWPWLGAAARPQLGRALQASDSQPGAAPVAVIGAELWRRFLGADPSIVGSRLKINGVDTEIVGVLPGALRFPMTQELWLPFRPPAGPLTRGQSYSMGTPQHVLALGRLKPGASREQATNELNLSAQRLAQDFPASNRRVGALALPYAAWGMPDVEMIYLGLAGAGALLLALVCLNTANLLLARANERRQELAVRAALGAPRGRLVMQMLIETWLLCLVAAALGVFFSAWALEATQQAVAATADGRLPFWIHFAMRPQAALVGLGLSLLTALATGLLPAWRASAVDLNAVLRDGRGGQGRASGRFARALVCLQIALSSLLLLASGLQTYVVHQRLTAGTGARMEGVLTARLTPRQAEYAGNSDAARAAREGLWNRLEARLAEAAASAGARLALSTSLPGGGMIDTDEILPEGMTVQENHYPLGGNYRINAGFFQAMEVKLLAGREFGPQDRVDSLKVAVVNQNFAQQHWPGQDPLGKRFAIVEGDAQKRIGAWITVVGVTPHVLQGIGRERGLRAANFYLPISQHAPGDMGIALVGVPDNTASRELLARAVAQTDPGLALEQVFSAEERQRIAHGGEDVMAAMSLILGLLTLGLASSGIYGVTSRAVQLRSQEIGVRRAVGANDAQLMRMLLGQALRLLALALPLGLLGGALALAGELGSSLPLGLGVTAVALLITGLVLFSTWLPARRALRQSPTAALNSP